MEVTLEVLAWLQGTQAWAVPARMAANDTEGWRTAVEAEGAANEELESRYWVTHTLCRAAVAANEGVIGRGQFRYRIHSQAIES